MKSLNFAKRNIINFFRDKTAVFFALLSALIAIGLYVLFLGDSLTASFTEMFGDKTRFIMNSWIMAGIISITSITAAMGAFEAMVTDNTSGIIKDFYSAPLSKRDIATGYILSSFVVGVVLSVAALIFAELYILIYGGSTLPLLSYIKILGIILLSSLSSCTTMFFLVSFLKSASAFVTFSTIVGTLIGFLAGIYLPIGQLPSMIQGVIKLIPVSHSASLLRQLMMNDALQQSSLPAEFLNKYNLEMGIRFEAFGTTIEPYQSILFIIFATILFFILSVALLNKKKNK